MAITEASTEPNGKSAYRRTSSAIRFRSADVRRTSSKVPRATCSRKGASASGQRSSNQQTSVSTGLGSSRRPLSETGSEAHSACRRSFALSAATTGPVSRTVAITLNRRNATACARGCDRHVARPDPPGHGCCRSRPVAPMGRPLHVSRTGAGVGGRRLILEIAAVIVAVLGGLAAGPASSLGHWWGPLDLVRRYPAGGRPSFSLRWPRW